GRGAAAVVAWSIGLGVLALAARRRSLTLALAASLLLSPIVWLHYFVLLVIPLALRWSRFAPAWLVPLLFWFCPGAGAPLRDIGIGLAVFAVVIAVCATPRSRPTPLPPRRQAEVSAA